MFIEQKILSKLFISSIAVSNRLNCMATVHNIQFFYFMFPTLLINPAINKNINYYYMV